MKIELNEMEAYTISDCIIQTMHDLRAMQKSLAINIPQLQDRIRQLNNLNNNLLAQVRNTPPEKNRGDLGRL